LEKVLPDFFSYLKATLSPLVFREQKELPKNILMEKIMQKISAFADDEKSRKFMLIEMAAYLCQLGHGKAQTDGEKCRAKHEQRREWVKYKYNKKLELKYTRKLVYDTIVDFYDAQVAENVVEATLDVAKKIGAAMKAKDNEKVAEYSSALKIGNEH
jgi:ABC-type polar amino acid transport system ATPase subunit